MSPVIPDKKEELRDISPEVAAIATAAQMMKHYNCMAIDNLEMTINNAGIWCECEDLPSGHGS